MSAHWLDQGPALADRSERSCTVDDLHAVDGDWPVKPTPPLIPGHEGAGIDSGYSVERHVRRICHRFGSLCRTPAGVTRLCRAGADPVRGRHHLQRFEGDRGAAGRIGGDLGIGGLGHVAVQYASWRAPLAPMSRSMRSHLARHKGTAALCGLRPASSRRRSLMWYRSAPPSAASSSAPARTLPRCWRSPPRGTCARRFSGAAGGHQQHLRRHQGEQGRRADGGDDVTCARFRPSSFWCRPRNLPSSPRKRVSRWQVPPLRPLGSRPRGNDDRSGDEDRKGTDSVNSRQVPTSVARVGRPPSIRLPRRDGHGRLPRPRTRPQRCRRAGNRRPAPPVRRRSCAGHCGR